MLVRRYTANSVCQTGYRARWVSACAVSPQPEVNPERLSQGVTVLEGERGEHPTQVGIGDVLFWNTSEGAGVQLHTRCFFWYSPPRTRDISRVSGNVVVCVEWVFVLGLGDISCPGCTPHTMSCISRFGKENSWVNNPSSSYRSDVAMGEVAALTNFGVISVSGEDSLSLAQ
jgi:hypothetical protein